MTQKQFSNEVYNIVFDISKYTKQTFLIDIDVVQKYQYNWSDTQQYIENSILIPRRIYYNKHCSKLSDIDISMNGCIEKLYYLVRNNMHIHGFWHPIDTTGTGNFIQFTGIIKKNELRLDIKFKFQIEFEIPQKEYNYPKHHFYYKQEYSYKKKYSQICIPNCQIRIYLSHQNPQRSSTISYLISQNFANKQFLQLKQLFI